MEIVKNVAKKVCYAPGENRISKEKALSILIAVLVGLPTILPQFAAWIPGDVRNGIAGVAALLVIVFRESRK